MTEDHKPRVHAALAEGYLGRSEYAEAEKACRRALSDDRQDVEARRLLMRALLGQESYKAGVDEGLLLVEAISDDTDALRLTGECLLRVGKPGAARAVLRRAARLDRDDRRGLALLARTDISISSSPDKAREYDRQEADLYRRFKWVPEEIDISQATMELDMADIEALDDVAVMLLPSSELPPVDEETSTSEHSAPSLELEVSASQVVGVGELSEEHPNLPARPTPDEVDESAVTAEFDPVRHGSRPGTEDSGARQASGPAHSGPSSPYAQAAPPAADPAARGATRVPGRAGPSIKRSLLNRIAPLVRLISGRARSPTWWALPAGLLAIGLLVWLGLYIHARRVSNERHDQARRALLSGRDADYTTAAGLLRQTLADNPEDVASVATLALALAAETYELAASPRVATEAVAAAGRLAPEAPETCAAQAYMDLYTGDSAAARGRLTRCVEAFPNDPFLRYLIGRALKAAGERAAAVSQLDAAIQIVPGMVVAHVARAEAELAAGRYEAALDAVGRGMVAAPGHPQGLLSRARLRLQAGRDLDRVRATLGGLEDRKAELSAGNRAWLHLLQAEAAQAAGDTESAAVKLNRALEDAPESPRYLARAARACLRGYRPVDAKALLDRAARLGNGRSEVALLRAELHLMEGKAEAALKALASASQDQGETHLLEARAYLEIGWIPAARRALAKGMEVEGARLIEALVSYREGRTEQALASLRGLAQAENAVDEKVALAEILLERAELAEARQVLEQAATLAPSHPGVRMAKGEALLRAGRPSLAVESFEKALKIHPTSVKGRTGLARGLVAKGDLERAAKELGTLLKDGKGPPAAQLALADLKVEQGVVAGARAALGKATAGGAGGVQAGRLSGLIALAERRPARAVELLRAAVDESPSDGRLRVALARAYLEAGRSRESRAELKEVFKTDPDDPEARLVLGRLLTFEEYDLEAITELKRAVKVLKERGSSSRKQAEALAALALAYFFYGEHGNALVLLDDAHRLQPERADVYLYRGRTFEKLERPARALEQYEKAVNADASLAEAHYRYGAMLMARGGSRAEAAAHLRRYMALSPRGEFLKQARRLLGER